MIHRIKIQKSSRKRLNDEKVKAQLRAICARAVNRTREARGWVVRRTKPALVEDAGTYRYEVELRLRCKPRRARKPESIAAEFETIKQIVMAAGTGKGWALSNGESKVAAPAVVQDTGMVVYAHTEVGEEWKEHFSHIYERDAQVDVILSAIKAAQESDFQNRFHVVLYGSPASGKTAICRAVKAMLGDDAVMEYDATATTQAGAIKDLASREELPRVLIVEEIEKTGEDSLRWLLGVLDHRAEVRKVTYRESIQREVKLLVIATVNDFDLFSKLMYGALASRFAHQLYCPQPNRDLLRRILDREIEKTAGGKKEWIEPALDYATERQLTDPRKITAICLCGQDALLTGEYQTKLKACEPSTGR